MLEQNQIHNEDYERIIRNYKSAEECYKYKCLRSEWLCTRCQEEKFEWVCHFSRGMEPTHGVDPRVCGTCKNNSNNDTFGDWESGKCSKGKESQSPCDFDCKGKEWRPGGDISHLHAKYIKS